MFRPSDGSIFVLLCPRLTSAMPSSHLAMQVVASLTPLQISLGNAHSPPHLPLPHLRQHLPCRFWALKIIASSPGVVRLICDSCSSEQCFAFSFLQPRPHDLNLAVRLVVLSAEPTRDFNPQVSAPCQAHNKKNPSFLETRDFGQ